MYVCIYIYVCVYAILTFAGISIIIRTRQIKELIACTETIMNIIVITIIMYTLNVYMYVCMYDCMYVCIRFLPSLVLVLLLVPDKLRNSLLVLELL